MNQQDQNDKDKEIGFIMCVCTGKCPGFAKMDIWDFIIHPQLCEEDGDRFLNDYLRPGRKYLIAACAPNMQYKLFRDAFEKVGLDVKKDLIPLDIREMTTDQAVELVQKTLENIKKDGDKKE